MKASASLVVPRSIWLLSVALLGGCQGDMGDLKKFVEDAKAADKGQIAPLPAIESYPPFLYAAEAVRDPFVPLDQPKAEGPETKPPGSGLQPDRTRPKEELEAAPLDALRMMGTLAQQGSSWALVRNVDGVIHRVKPGNYLGQNYGKIVSISDDKVDLVEIIPDGADSWRERNASLALSQ